MATERRSGAGSRLSGVLALGTPPSAPTAEPEELDPTTQPVEPAEPEPEPEPAAPARGRAVAPKRAKAAESLAAKGFKGRTVYMPDDLFERLLVQAHRRDKTISEYVVLVLERGVPDHRAPRRAGRPEASEAEGQGEAEAVA
jgi:hypothetical protein